MTRIRATCPTCGEVDLAPIDVVLRVVRESGGDLADGSSYRFDCPDCRQLVRKPADERIVELLLTGGVPVEEVPAARSVAVSSEASAPLPLHPEEPPSGPPLTYDDLLDLHLLLNTDGWFEHLLSTSR